MATLKRFYGFSFIFTLICLGLGAWYGWSSTGTIGGTAALLWIVWGAGIALHAARTFLWGGDWERREVERRLGRSL